MRETFLDITKHTGDLGFLDTVKITGTSDQTLIESMDADKNVILKGLLKEPSAQLEGDFGLSNLPLLKFYCNFANFKSDDASVDIIREKRGDRELITEIRFASADTESTATYRVMNADLVPDQHKFLGKDWDIEFIPTKSKIAEFSELATGLMSIETYFMPKTDDAGNLRFYIGDEAAATNKASMVFQKDVKATFAGGLHWPIQPVLSILKLAASNGSEPTMSFLAKGALQISFESKFGDWKYILPAKRR